MTKTMTALAATAAVLAATVSMTPQADARPRGGAIAAGVIGGIAAGAIAAGAYNSYAQAPAYGYYGGGAYDGAYAYEPSYGYGYGYNDYYRAPNSYNNSRQLVGK